MDPNVQDQEFYLDLSLTFEGYIYTPDTNMISGSNTVELGIFAFNERDENCLLFHLFSIKLMLQINGINLVLQKQFQSGKIQAKSQCGIYIRYNQYNNADGVVYIDDLTVFLIDHIDIMLTSLKQMKLNFNSYTKKNTIRGYWRNWNVKLGK